MPSLYISKVFPRGVRVVRVFRVVRVVNQLVVSSMRRVVLSPLCLRGFTKIVRVCRVIDEKAACASDAVTLAAELSALLLAATHKTSLFLALSFVLTHISFHWVIKLGSLGFERVASKLLGESLSGTLAIAILHVVYRTD